MRLRPAFPLTARLATEPFELPGLTIPSGTMIAPYITLVNRRPELYPDPLTFRPERFLDTRAGTYTWIPFGGGPRRCIGAAFSLTEARIVLRTILRHARLEPSRRRSERVAHRNVFIGPARGGRITLQLRTPHPNHHPHALPRDHAGERPPTASSRANSTTCSPSSPSYATAPSSNRHRLRSGRGLLA